MIELMVTLAVVAILAAIAVPSYQSYIKKSRLSGAKSDVVGMSLAMERAYQKDLAYPAFGTCGSPPTPLTVAAAPASRTASAAPVFSGWIPTQASAFQYAVQSSKTIPPAAPNLCGDVYGYEVSATANNGFELNGCVIVLQGTGARTATANCGFTAW